MKKKNLMATMTRPQRLRYLENLLMLWRWRRANA